MKNINVLDCTLRDGGYCNNWEFGKENSQKIIENLIEAGVEFVECGFLSNKVTDNDAFTKFRTIKQAAKIIPEGRSGTHFVAMINYGEYDVVDLPQKTNDVLIDGIRVAFHKKDATNAMQLCKEIKNKGYFVYIQPMVSVSYSDEEFLQLIKSANDIRPFAFYIVDSFGAMKRKDMIRLFYMVEHNIDLEIAIGFHSHNNMQLSFSNAQTLVDIRTKHRIIIDSCIYGMGRGAGNLNTELFLEYLNDNLSSHYIIKPILTVIDDILDDFYHQNYWGFSLPNYLSANHNTHPNYAGYLNDRHTLTVEGMNDIFEMMDDEKRVYYDKNYIEELYFRYLSRDVTQANGMSDFLENIRDKDIIIIAPGKSSTDEKEKILTFCKKSGVVSIGVNFDYSFYSTNYIFVSNQRRFKEIKKDRYNKCIVTSNIPADKIYLQTDYKTLLSNHAVVRDNAGLLLLRFLINCGVKNIFIAGLDGYSHDISDNFGDSRLTYIARTALLDEMNTGMTEVLNEYAKEAKISFITKPKHVFIFPIKSLTQS